VFDLSIPKLLILAVIALVIFGPNELPKIAAQAGKALRDLRRIAEGAKNDLRDGLGPEFADFEIEDLNPKRFVQKHLFDDVNGDNGNSAARDTATNPAVLTAFALAIIAGGSAPAYPGIPGRGPDMTTARRDAGAIGLAMGELRKLVPDGGSYVSESNFFESDWQRSFWGANYPRLQAVKAKYDPDGLFFVHHGVGSEDWSDDGFTRLTAR